MRVPLCRRGLHVPQHLANQVERATIGNSDAREPVAEVMEPYALESGRLNQLSPYCGDAQEVALAACRGENPRRAFTARQVSQHVERGSAQGHDLGARLGVRQPQGLPLEIDMR